MNLDRRQLITGLISFVAAPAIVRASSLMAVRASPVQVQGINLLPIGPSWITWEQSRLYNPYEPPYHGRDILDTAGWLVQQGYLGGWERDYNGNRYDHPAVNALVNEALGKKIYG